MTQITASASRDSGDSPSHAEMPQQQQAGSFPAEVQQVATDIPQRPRWLQRLENVILKVAVPLNRQTMAMGCESFVPMPLDQEVQKAARILRAFSQCPSPPARDAIQQSAAEQQQTVTPLTTLPASRHIVTIPPSAIADAVGLAIFTTGRIGIGRLSGSTGSGVLISRRTEDGLWGAPKGIQAHSVGAGPVALGLDVTDRIYVFYTRQALDMVTRARLILGPEVVLAAGSYGGGGGMSFGASFADAGRKQPKKSRGSEQPAGDTAGADHQNEKQQLLESVGEPRDGVYAASNDLRSSLRNPLYCYMRSYGFYLGLQAEGAIFSELKDAGALTNGADQPLTEALRLAEFGQGR
jgi:SH3 domain-containing YSC84-like protein 1